MKRGARLMAVSAGLAIALGASGCGSDKGSGSTTGATQPTAAQPSQTSTTKVKAGSGEAKLGIKPPVAKGHGQPPTRLVVQDLVVGHGKAAKAGDTLSVQYVGVLFDSGKEFDASWSGNRPGQAFEFPLGAGQVIPGWDRGLVGMKEGGRRKLIIPSDLAYGAQGAPPDIPPNAALIFDIDLEKVTPR